MYLIGVTRRRDLLLLTFKMNGRFVPHVRHRALAQRTAGLGELCCTAATRALFRPLCRSNVRCKCIGPVCPEAVRKLSRAFTNAKNCRIWARIPPERIQYYRNRFGSFDHRSLRTFRSTNCVALAAVRRTLRGVAMSVEFPNGACQQVEELGFFARREYL
jgi:hypothetical protein